MTGELDDKLEELKQYSSDVELSKINKRVFNLDLDSNYLSTLSQNYLLYIHVKLHNALAYRKPFAKIKEIKKIHDQLVPFLKFHTKSDKLDE